MKKPGAESLEDKTGAVSRERPWRAFSATWGAWHDRLKRAGQEKDKWVLCFWSRNFEKDGLWRKQLKTWVLGWKLWADRRRTRETLGRSWGWARCGGWGSLVRWRFPGFLVASSNRRAKSWWRRLGFTLDACTRDVCLPRRAGWHPRVEESTQREHVWGKRRGQLLCAEHRKEMGRWVTGGGRSRWGCDRWEGERPLQLLI